MNLHFIFTVLKWINGIECSWINISDPYAKLYVPDVSKTWMSKYLI